MYNFFVTGRQSTEELCSLHFFHAERLSNIQYSVKCEVLRPLSLFRRRTFRFAKPGMILGGQHFRLEVRRLLLKAATKPH